MTFRQMLSGWKSVATDEGQTLYFRRKRTVFFYAVLYLALLALMRHFLADLPMLFLLACMMFFFVLHILFLFYCAVIGQTRKVLTYRSGGRLAWFFSRRWMLFLVNVVVAMGLSFLCVVRLAAMSPVDFGIMGLTLLFMAAMYEPVARWVASESIPVLVCRRVMGWSLLGAVIVTFLLQVGAAFLGCYDAPAYVSIKEALDSRTIGIMTGSNIINHVLDASSYLQTCEMYFLSQMVQGGVAYAAVTALLAMFSFGSVLAAFAPVMIPPSEQRRIFIPRAIPSTEVPSCDKKSVFWFSVAGMLMFFGGAFLFAGLDSSAGSASAEEKVETLKETTTEYVVQVDGVLYRSGVYDEVQNLKREYSDLIDKAQQGVLLSRARICGAMEANVDRFLDWYYSLGAEYMRVAKTLVGDGKQYVEEKFEENLGYGIDMESFERELSNLRNLKEEYDYMVVEAKQKFRLSEAPEAEVPVVALDNGFFDLLDRDAAIGFESRMKISSVLGMTSAAGTMATRLVSPNIISAATWIVSDTLLLSLDEYSNRDDMRRAILASIQEQCQ